jgi:hypothetical protein
MTNALDVQVGGGHYKDLAIQPVEYIHKNNLTYLEGTRARTASRTCARRSTTANSS